MEFDAAEMAIHGVRIHGRSVRFSAFPSVVKVFLDQEVSPGSSIDIEIEYSATPRKGLSSEAR